MGKWAARPQTYRAYHSLHKQMIAYLEATYDYGCSARVPSETDPNKEYRALVMYVPETDEVRGRLAFSCSCPVWTNRGLQCKHVDQTIIEWKAHLDAKKGPGGPL